MIAIGMLFLCKTNAFISQDITSNNESSIEYLGLMHSVGISVRIPYLVVSVTAMFGELEFKDLEYYSSFSDNAVFLEETSTITKPMKLKGVTISAGVHF